MKRKEESKEIVTADKNWEGTKKRLAIVVTFLKSYLYCQLPL